jgi:hypothetical protein
MDEVSPIASYLIFEVNSHLLMDEQMLHSFCSQMITLLNFLFYYVLMNLQVEDLSSFTNIILLLVIYHLYQLRLKKNLLKSNKNLESHCNSHFLNVNIILTLAPDYQLHFNQLNQPYCIKKQNSSIR